MNTRCGFLHVRWLFWKGEGGPPLFPCPFLAEVSPFTNPHRGNISISSPSTIKHRLLALAPERETFPPPLSLPSKLLSRWMLVALPCLFPSPVPARGKQREAEGTEGEDSSGQPHGAGRCDPGVLSTTEVLNSFCLRDPSCPRFSPSAPHLRLPSAPHWGLPQPYLGVPLSPTLGSP